ncbi:hypothetical protein STCU_00714 [Strigomonas culicis]|uniref:Uncharacterized protein n=1 Tax=Strigomonas culicis TaxID=28005 RepID=S9UZC4_9TRYP|nr:hypothetical protein STCU_01686 [Strigomonas culicis]EPY36182.1 hypothetical protein STCU_00714 [Strigomonas culicis]|eukprot:EPY34284.1 hypothetical protein STCU_01686 [Strigomonas culicis]
MFSTSTVRRIGSPTYGKWPWPVKLPLKADWYHHLSRRNSIADETRQYFVVGDLLILGVVGFSAFRIFQNVYRSNAYQTHLCTLTNYPPAIIANEFDFEDASKNRKVERKDLDTYREEVVTCKATARPIESIIFKY